jgi:hypothetical protein
MSISIREVDVERELEQMRAIHNENRERHATLERFRWSYLDNPAGRAKAWFALDDRSGVCAGFAAAFPRRVRLAGSAVPVDAWTSGDFSISRRYRTMGVALKLRRALRDDVDRGDCPFFYSHPNERMVPVHLKAGHTVLGRMVRYVKLLRLPTTVLGVLSSFPLRLFGLDMLVRTRYEPEWITDGPLKAEFDHLFAAVAERVGTCVVRDARYLEWRFLRNPVERTDLLAVREAGALKGYLAYSVRDHYVAVKDWLADGAEARSQLFAGFIANMRRAGVSWISAAVLEGHPDTGQLYRFGFLPRSRAAVVFAHAGQACVHPSAVLKSSAWYMTAGDRDV